MGFYYYDWTYFLFMIPALVITMWAQFRVKSTFSRYSQIRNDRGVTGSDAARTVLRMHGVTDVGIERVSGSLTDHFDPSTKVIRLSDSVGASDSVAAVGVAAHEAGHAVQHAQGYFPIRLRSAIVPVVRIASNLAMPMIIIGLILPLQYQLVTTLGIIFYTAAIFFEVVTLPVEINASRRALAAINDSGMLSEEERKGAKKVLTAAAMTYLASAFVALLNLLRILLIVNRRRER